jgi:hypothetical protein
LTFLEIVFTFAAAKKDDGVFHRQFFWPAIKFFIKEWQI